MTSLKKLYLSNNITILNALSSLKNSKVVDVFVMYRQYLNARKFKFY